MLIGIARFSHIIGLVERPLALSLVAAFATDLWDVALPLGITLELLWLDVVAMGSIIQPFGGMAFLLLFPLSATLSWTQPGVLLLPLVLCILAAHIGAYCELKYRIQQNCLLDRVSRMLAMESEASEVRDAMACAAESPDIRKTLQNLPASDVKDAQDTDASAAREPMDPGAEQNIPESLLHQCFVGRICWHVLLYLASYAILCLVVSTLIEWNLYPVLPNLQWVFVYALATIGAILSLRQRRAYIVCGLSILVIVALLAGEELIKTVN